MMRLVSNLWCALLVLLLSAAAADGQVINSFSPLFASPGEIVVIQGSGFTGVSAVQFANGRSATFTATSDTQISATVPSGTVSGPIGVLKSGNLVFSVQSFTAIGPGPYVDSFTPATGNQGVQVTFTGVHFTGVTSVSFNGVAGTSVSVTADTQLRATVPAGATSGSITVTSPAGSWTTGTPFYLPPSISSFSPGTGTPGTAVTINGANFLNASAVRFNGVSAAYTVNTVTRITATVPAGATSGTISVTAPAGGGSSPSSFTLLVAPTITTQPASQTVAVGSSVTFTVSASSATAYQWRYNGANISGANSSSFTKSNLQTTDSGSYDVLVSNTAGTVTSSTATLTVAVPPAITSQPQNRTVNPGVSATFSASASGSAPLSYQWRRNGANISGATGSSYTLDNPQAADSGSTFSVRVSNAVGSATSSAATLTVNSPPSILSQPSGSTIYTGQSVTFLVVANGSTPFTYQWQKNSANISGATAASYSINNAQTAHAGSYRVVVSNAFGSITSAAATLTVNNPVVPSFTSHPQSQTVDIGQTATFSAAATGSPSPSYQWRKNGANISGATGSSYTVSNVQLTHAGTYDVVASNLGGSVPSSPATLSVTGPPVITGQPASQTAVAGTTITLSVTASGSNPLTYQWRRDGTNLTGATSASLVLNAAQPGDSGYYSVVITNPNGSTTSTTATINVLPVGASPNRVLNLDGSGDFVTIPSAADLQTPTAFTIEGWFLPMENSNNHNAHFINKGDGANGRSARSYELSWKTNRGLIFSIFLTPLNEVDPDYLEISVDAPPQIWVHFAATFDSLARQCRVFTNGVLAASIALAPGKELRQCSLPLTFGGIENGTGTDATGQMDEIRIWSRARTPEEISGAMFCRLAGNEPGLAGYWTFDDGTARDLTGHGHHGVLSGGATTTLLLGAEPLHTTNQAPCITSQPQNLTVGIGQRATFAVTAVAGTNTGPFSFQWRRDGTNLIGATGASFVLSAALPGESGYYSVVISNQFGVITSTAATVTVVNRVLSLDGGGDFVTIPSAADLQSPDAFTLEAWIFPSAFGTNTSGQFFNKGDGQSVASVRSYELTWTPDRRIVAQVFLDATTWAVLATPAEQDRWVHVAVTYDSGPGRLSLFTNGLLAASTTRDASGQVLLAGQRIRQTTLPLVFGQLPGNGNSYANGQMDEVRIWSRVRSPEEIAGAMFCRLAGTEPGLSGYWTFDDGTATDLSGHGHDGTFVGNASATTLLGSDPLHSTNQAPCITSQPQSLTVGIGQTASFAVTVVAGASAGPFSYQWRKDGINLTGATSGSFTKSNLQLADSGNYDVVVSNTAGSVTSTVAILTASDFMPAANMALIPAGSFQMGDTFVEGNSGELPVHSVYVSAFYIDQHEVTKALWDEVKTWNGGNGYGYDNPGSGKAPNHPVHTVNWFDMVKWCNARSEKEGRVPVYYTDAGFTQVYKTGQVTPYPNWLASGYRLPTEAEWEKAARGGASGHRFPWSDADTINQSRANYDSYWVSGVPYLPYDVNSTSGYHPVFSAGAAPYTSPVGYFAPNGYGLYDMAGNVWERCWDWYGAYSSGSQTNPRGAISGSHRVQRGGSSGSGADCRTALRNNSNPADGYFTIGFRSVLSPPASPGITVTGSFPAPTVPLLWWRGDGDANDFQGNRNGMLLGNVTYAAGKVNEAFGFDGTNGAVLRTADVPTSATDDWAMSAWVYWRGRTFTAGQPAQVILYNGDTGFNGYGITITEQGDASTIPILAPSLGKMVVLFGGVGYLVTTNALDTNVWNHLVLTRESGVVKLYKDGQLIALPNGSAPKPPSTANGGGFFVSAPSPASFNGRIDDVCFFGSALTSNQVQAIYQAGAAGFTRSPEFSQVSIQPDGMIRLTLKGRTGSDLSLQSSTNLLTWEPLDTVINWPGSNTLSYPVPASGGRRFYRALHP